MTVPCRCALPSHEHPKCPNGVTVAAQGKFYAGLYDSRGGKPAVRRAMRRVLHNVRLLNPDYDDEDEVGRRFAQLEID